MATLDSSPSKISGVSWSQFAETMDEDNNDGQLRFQSTKNDPSEYCISCVIPKIRVESFGHGLPLPSSHVYLNSTVMILFCVIFVGEDEDRVVQTPRRPSDTIKLRREGITLIRKQTVKYFNVLFPDVVNQQTQFKSSFRPILSCQSLYNKTIGSII